MTKTDQLAADALVLVRSAADFASWATNPPKGVELAPIAAAIETFVRELRATAAAADAERLHPVADVPADEVLYGETAQRVGEQLRNYRPSK